MGGHAYNPSLAAGRSARNMAATRTPVHFWLDVPYYVYELPCKDELTGDLHTFRSRTPASRVEGRYHFWCERCRDYVSVRDVEPMNRPHSTDEIAALDQDKGILRERIGRTLQAEGFLETDEQIAEATARDWSLEPGVELRVPVGEIKKVNAALVAPEGLSGLPDLCRAGLHELTPENTMATTRGSDGSRRCRACYMEARRNAQAAYRDRAKKRSTQSSKAA